MYSYLDLINYFNYLKEYPFFILCGDRIKLSLIELLQKNNDLSDISMTDILINANINPNV